MKKKQLVSVGITRLVLMFRRVSNNHFNIRYYKLVASQQVEIPYYRGVGRQRGRGFEARAQVQKTREFCIARGTTMKNFLMKLWKRLCLNLFSKRE